MSKELPYFRFAVNEWLNDDISLEDYHIKGLFADICAYYWFKDCSITQAMLYKRFNNAEAMIKQLLNNGIIKTKNGSDFIEIKFLNEQYDLLSESRKRRQDAGSKGGKQRSSNAKAKLKQSSSYKDKDKENDKDKYIPDFDEFKKYALENNPSIDVQALELKYKAWVENKWKDGNGKKIINWKSKLLNTIPYLKSENNIGNNQRSVKRVNDLWK